MWFRSRHVLWSALFLWAVVFGFKTGAWRWVIWPYIVVGLFLTVAEYLQRNEPLWARRLTAVLLFLTFQYNVLLLLPAVQRQFPEIFETLSRRRADIDVEIANRLEPCLASVKSAVRSYAVKREAADARAIEQELNGLLNRANQGQFAPADRDREREIRERIREFARDRTEWFTVLQACGEDRVEQRTTGGATSSNPETPGQVPASGPGRQAAQVASIAASANGKTTTLPAGAGRPVETPVATESRTSARRRSEGENVAESPSEAPEASTPARVSSPAMTTGAAGVSFELMQCLAFGTSVRCDLFVRNELNDRVVRIGCGLNSGMTKAFDDSGNETVCERARLANKETHGVSGDGAMLVSGVRTRLQLTFERVNAAAQEFSLMGMDFADDSQWSKVDFRHVPITRPRPR